MVVLDGFYRLVCNVIQKLETSDKCIVGKIVNLELFESEKFKLERFTVSRRNPFEVGKVKISWKEFDVVGNIQIKFQTLNGSLQLKIDVSK